MLNDISFNRVMSCARDFSCNINIVGWLRMLAVGMFLVVHASACGSNFIIFVSSGNALATENGGGS